MFKFIVDNKGVISYYDLKTGFKGSIAIIYGKMTAERYPCLVRALRIHT
jgi:hypothetical protein